MRNRWAEKLLKPVIKFWVKKKYTEKDVSDFTRNFFVSHTLETENFNISRTAKRLGVSRPTLVRWLDDFGIPRLYKVKFEKDNRVKFEKDNAKTDRNSEL